MIIYIDLIKMKGSKVGSSFITKFSSFLSKFKQTSTINIAHDQIRKLFSEYKYSDIVVPFISKMDSCDQLNDKQKKQHSKVYITLIDVFGQDVILQHYQRLIQSLAKKSIGVSEVIGYLCKSLINRIYPVENISNYIRHLLAIFKQHPQIPKIIKQIMQSFDGQLTDQFQIQMLGTIGDKINLNKSKTQYLEAILSIVLSLQNRFKSESIVQGLVVKNFKNQDWNTRKLCVDISYAILVIKQQANAVLHESIKQMKYDKIKHVREAVSNYYILHRQIYGEQVKKNQTPVSQKRVNSKIGMSKSPSVRKAIGLSIENNARSLEKNTKKSRNEDFFQNAKNKDVIKMPQQNKSLTISKEKMPMKPPNSKSLDQELPMTGNSSLQKNSPKQHKTINFQNYIKNRSSKNEYFGLTPNEKSQNPPEKDQPVEASKPIEGPATFRKRKQQQSQIPFQSPLADSSLSLIQETNQSIKEEILSLKEIFITFQHHILAKVTSIESRVDALEKKINESKTTSSDDPYDSRKYNKINEQSEASIRAESNLQQKIKDSIVKNNWDEAFALVLANNKKTILMELLTHCRIPSDKLVIDCLFMQVKKELKSCITLKWLLSLIQETEIGTEKLKKLKKDLQKTTKKLSEEEENRNYLMLRNMLLNELEDKLA